MAFINLFQGLLGKQTGPNVTPASGEYGDGLVTELQPRFYEQTYRGNTFSAQWAAGALAAPSATVAGAFSFYNPTTSGKNVVLLDSTIALASFTASANPLIVELQKWTYVPTTITSTAPVNTFIGSSSSAVSQSLVMTVGTLVGASTTPIKVLGGFYLDLTAGDSVGYLTYNFDGKFIIAPGSGISFCALATVPTHTAVVDMTWMEVLV